MIRSGMADVPEGLWQPATVCAVIQADLVQVVSYERPTLSKAYLFPEGEPASCVLPLWPLSADTGLTALL